MTKSEETLLKNCKALHCSWLFIHVLTSLSSKICNIFIRRKGGKLHIIFLKFCYVFSSLIQIVIEWKVFFFKAYLQNYKIRTTFQMRISREINIVYPRILFGRKLHLQKQTNSQQQIFMNWCKNAWVYVK